MGSTDRPTYTVRGVKDLGDWMIEFDLPGDGNVEAFNRMIDWSVDVFLEAFATMGDVESARGDIEVLDDQGRIEAYHEDVPLFRVGGRYRPPSDAGVPQPSSTVLLRHVWLDCGLVVLEDGDTSYVPDNWYFMHNCAEGLADDGRVEHDPPFAVVHTHTDVWLDVTRPLNTLEHRDNRRLAALNRPRLEAFLRRWEQLAGKPISRWTSERTSRIQRYGFDPEPPQETS